MFKTFKLNFEVAEIRGEMQEGGGEASPPLASPCTPLVLSLVPRPPHFFNPSDAPDHQPISRRSTLVFNLLM